LGFIGQFISKIGIYLRINFDGYREIKDFLTNHIQPEYRVGDVSNSRKVKKDVLRTLKKILPDNILLDKKKYGRRVIRLVYGT